MTTSFFDRMAKNSIEETLRKLPEVAWDRWTGDMDATLVYGWVERADCRADFVVLRFERGTLFNFVTSSAQYSSAFAARLGFDVTDHKPCKRVEGFFHRVNCIRL
jgi:hypothetical protein